MSKNGNAETIVSNLHEAIGGQIINVTKSALNEFENMLLNPEQARGVQQALDGVVDQVEEKGAKMIDAAQQMLNDGIRERIEQIGIIPKDMQEQIIESGTNVVNQVTDIAKNALKEAGKEVKEIAADAVKQVFGAVKSVFSNIGAVVTAEKTTDQALSDVKQQFQEAGKSIGKTAKGFVMSFVEKLGFSGEKAQSDAKVSHAQKLQKQNEQQVQNQGKGGRGD